MTLARCKENLLEILAGDANRVVALSGKWGTGKSHLWREVQGASGEQQVKDAIYVSLFGAGSVSELKLKIAQQALPKLQAGGAVAERIRDAYAGTKKVLRSLHSGFSALDELALIATPMLLKSRFIVVDDIERKHEKLSIDEILGFIDDCVQNLGCRILLILNSDQLGDKKLWDLFREKVIDQELRLDTSPGEAFDIACGIAPADHAAELRQAVETCRITNIRILVKIIRVSKRLLGNAQLGPEVLARVIPSIVLLSAIHYKGLDDGPDFDFVLDFDNYMVNKTIEEADEKDGAKEPTEQDKSRERWRLTMEKLGIRGTDEFESLVVDYLKSGLVDAGGVGVGKIVERYAAEGRELAARTRAQEFFDRSIWHPEVDDARLVEELRALLPDIGHVDMFTVTALHRQAQELPGGGDVGRELIAAWIDAFRRKRADGRARLDPDYNYFRRPMHPDIEAEIRALQARHQTTATVLEVCKRVYDDSSWGQRERSFMRAVTPQGYEEAIRAATGEDLKTILLQSMDFLKNRGMYEDSFGGGVQAFLDAARSIFSREPGSRLGRLIRDLFADSRMDDQLAVPGKGATPENAPAR